MKILSWNYRGLENPQTVQDLCCLVREMKSNMVFFIETKLTTSRLENIKRRLRFEGCFAVEPYGRGGGLARMWTKDTKLKIMSYSLRHISAWIYEEKDKRKWMLTGFYRHLEACRREEASNLLASIKPPNHQAWCVIGDFNEIVLSDEKVGGN